MSTLWSYLLITACLLYGLGADETSETTRGRPFRRRKGPFQRRYGEVEEEQAEKKAQCKKPTIEHVERFSEDKEFYDSYEGIKVHCKSGYYPSSDTMMCFSPGDPKEWMPSTVTCLPQCRRPTVENMERISEDKEYYEKYDTAEVWCKPGYDPESFTMTCMEPQTSKEWTNIGTCKAQCKQPTIKNVGRLLPGQEYYNEKEVLTILCKPGYSPTSDTMRCENPNTPQEWNPPIVSCKARCKRPVIEHMLNPYPYKMSYDEEEVVRVDCKSRHYPSYDTTRCVHPLTPQEWIPAVTCIGMTVMEKVTSTSVSVWMSCTPSECPHHWRLEVELCDVHYGLCKTLDTEGNATFADLQPSYDYTIGITLHNNRTQTKMVPRLIKTNQPVSGQFNIEKFPTMEDSTMRWAVPYKWENITGFNLTVSARRDYDRSFALDDSIWFPPSVTEYKIPFQYGATYTISLRAFTSAGAERIREWITKTDIGDPPQHPKDTLRGNALQLSPVPAANGPISSYEVIVYPVQDRNLSMDCLGFINTPYNSSLTLSGYTAAVLPAETLTEPRTFPLGDNHHYNGFLNAPLIPNHKYTVYIRVTSRWRKVKKSSCAFAGVTQDKIIPSKKTTTVSGRNSSGFKSLAGILHCLCISTLLFHSCYV
ncbi:receptor-type tyrosine-protein phosphatase kappa-like isoform X1 [Lithobates pipiens]